jgi:hypothetical protein
VLAALRGDPAAPEFDDVWADELEDPDEERSLAQFKGLFESGTPDLRSRLFGHLLSGTLRVVCSGTAAYWKAVWDAGSEEERTTYAREAMRSAERLSTNNRERAPFRYGGILDALIKESPGDRLVFMLASLAQETGVLEDKADNDSAREARANVGKFLTDIAEKVETRTLWALDLAEVLAKRCGVGEAKRAVEDARARFFERLPIQQMPSDKALLGDWVFTRDRVAATT